MTSRSLTTAAVGVAIGLAAALLLLNPRTTYITWGVGVDVQTGVPSLDPLTIHSKDQVHWETATTKLLYIETEDKIFSTSVLQSNTKRYRVRCSANVCDSGALLTSLPSMPPNGYKYWQGLADPLSPNNPTWYDGHIIIIKP